MKNCESIIVLSKTEKGFWFSKAVISVALTFCLEVNEQKANRKFQLCFIGEGLKNLSILKSIAYLSVQICDLNLVIATAEF